MAAPDLTAEEIQKIADQLVVLRKKIHATGATVLSPTPVWDTLRKEIAALNKKLNADTKSKDKAREAAKLAEAAEAAEAAKEAEAALPPE